MIFYKLLSCITLKFVIFYLFGSFLYLKYPFLFIQSDACNFYINKIPKQKKNFVFIASFPHGVTSKFSVKVFLHVDNNK